LLYNTESTILKKIQFKQDFSNSLHKQKVLELDCQRDANNHDNQAVTVTTIILKNHHFKNHFKVKDPLPAKYPLL